MATFTFSNINVEPTPPKEIPYGRLTLPQRSIICQLDRHLRRSAKQQLNHREFIIIHGEHGTGKKVLLKHMLFLLDTAAHTTADFTYLRIRPGRYEWYRIDELLVFTFGELPVFYEEMNGEEIIRQDWDASPAAQEMRRVKMVLIENYHTLSGNDLSCLDFYLRRVATGDNCNAPFANCSIICLGNMYMPAPLTDDPLLYSTYGPWAVHGNNPHYLYEENITAAYFLRQSKQIICPDYKAFLDRLKTGYTSSEDFAIITSRMISNLRPDEIARFREAPRLFSYRRDAETYNLIEIRKTADTFAARRPDYPTYHKVLIVQNGFEKLYLSTGCKLILSRDINRDICLKFGCVGTFISATIRGYFSVGKVFELAASDIISMFVKFDCSTNHDMGDGPREYRNGTLIGKSWTKSYCMQEGRNKFLLTFPFINHCGSTHAAVQNIDFFPKLAIELGQNELRENQDYSIFSKLTSFNDLIILDSYVTAVRMKVGSLKYTKCHQEFERLSIKYEEEGLNDNAVKYFIQRPIGGSGRPKRAKVTFAGKTYIEPGPSRSVVALQSFLTRLP